MLEPVGGLCFAAPFAKNAAPFATATLTENRQPAPAAIIP
jgi:hypothetical protein